MLSWLFFTILICFQDTFAIDNNCKIKIAEIEVDYNKFEPTANYKTEIGNEELGVVYDLTKLFIDAVITNNFPSDLILVNTNGNIQIKNDNYIALLKYYMGFLALLAFLIIFAILMPIIGLIFSCCRCCGNCGGKQQNAASNDKCWTIVYLICILIFGALFMFGLIGIFQTNERAEVGIHNLVPKVKISVNDVTTYFDDTSEHIDLLLVQNYASLSDVVITRLSESGNLIYCEIQGIVDPDFIDNALDTLISLKNANKNLKIIVQTNTDLNRNVDAMITDVNKIKEDSTSVLKRIKEKGFSNNKIEITLTSIKSIQNIDKQSFPVLDFSELTTKLTNLFDQNILNTVKNGLDEYKTTPNQIKNNLQNQINEIKKTIKKTETEIENQSNNALDSVAEIVDLITKESTYYLDKADSYVNDYSIYRYSEGLAVCIVLLAVIIFIITGLVFGITCKKPSKTSCCNSKIGSSCLMISVGIMFITTIILVLITIIHLSAMTAQVVICEPLKDPNNEVIYFLDKLNLFDDKIDVNISSIIQNCYNDKSVYNVFNLENLIKLNEIENYIETSGIKNELNQIIAKIDVPIVDIIEEAQLIALTELSNSNVDLDQLNSIQNLPVFDFAVFNSLANSLSVIEENLADSGFELDKIALRDVINTINIDLKNKHEAMIGYIETMKMSGKQTQKAFEFNGNFKEGIEHLRDGITDIKQNLKNMPNSIKTVSKEFTEQIINVFETYLNYVVTNVRNNVGKCGPLATAVKGIVTATCDDILLQLNVFWFSLFWCLLLFVPMIFLSVKLASLFKKIERSVEKPIDDNLNYRNNRFKSGVPPGNQFNRDLQDYMLDHPKPHYNKIDPQNQKYLQNNQENADLERMYGNTTELNNRHGNNVTRF